MKTAKPQVAEVRFCSWMSLCWTDKINFWYWRSFWILKLCVRDRVREGPYPKMTPDEVSHFENHFRQYNITTLCLRLRTVRSSPVWAHRRHSRVRGVREPLRPAWVAPNSFHVWHNWMKIWKSLFPCQLLHLSVVCSLLGNDMGQNAPAQSQAWAQRGERTEHTRGWDCALVRAQAQSFVNQRRQSNPKRRWMSAPGHPALMHTISQGRLSWRLGFESMLPWCWGNLPPPPTLETGKWSQVGGAPWWLEDAKTQTLSRGNLVYQRKPIKKNTLKAMSHHEQESAETTSNRFQTRFLNLRAPDTLPGYSLLWGLSVHV